MLFRLLALLLLGVLAFAADTDPWGQPIPTQEWIGTGWPMRMRVCADYEAEIAWRLPYELLPKDQAKAAYSRVRNRLVYVPDGVASDGRPAVRMQNRLEWEETVGAELISEAAAAPPSDAAALAAAGDRLVGAKLAWHPYDYYASSPRRPFADPAWAQPGITAALGEAAGVRVLVVAHGTRLSVCILRGEIAGRAELLDQVQVMATGRGKRMQTWAESQGAAGSAIGSDGKPVKTARGPVAWKEGYEFESRHYHITGNSSPARLAAHAADLEALYKAYSEFFTTGEGAPLKFEVHIANTWQEFSDLSAACKNPLKVPKGTVLGGFFMPLYQSLWIYEESGKLGGPSMEIEHVMCHECSHQFLHMACNGNDRVPTWLNEGIAVHFENGILAGGTYRHRPPVDRIKRLAGLYKTEKATLQPMNVYLDHHGGIGADLYGEVYAMVHFWAFGAPGGRERFIAYWKAMRAGEDGLKAFERIFTADLAAAAGSRQAGLDRWRDQLLIYVQRELTKLR